MFCYSLIDQPLTTPSKCTVFQFFSLISLHLKTQQVLSLNTTPYARQLKYRISRNIFIKMYLKLWFHLIVMTVLPNCNLR